MQPRPAQVAGRAIFGTQHGASAWIGVRNAGNPGTSREHHRRAPDGRPIYRTIIDAA